EELPQRYQAPGFMPSLSTIAPHSTEAFFERLLDVKNRLYAGGNFQFQYSVHTTDAARRDEMIPVKKWSFAQMAEYGERFYAPGDRKITLNFALAEGQPLNPQVLLEYFDPAKFLIKITPLNPTYQAAEHGLTSYIDPLHQGREAALVDSIRAAGYQVITAIGEVEENYIGSNCGQYVRRHLEAIDRVIEGYTYRVETVA
ncbi:MAG TPA: radical SAM protein, partial [Chloroflexi bacterium]|nr:radical SAM protein [Chloroflexota bacterium]